MAYFFKETSHTFNEYLLIPGYSSSACIPANVNLSTPLVRYRRGEKSAITMNIPMVSAIMQSVSGDRLAVALAKEITEKGKICLMSPAAASYNVYQNFEERGECYRKLVTGETDAE